MSEPEGLQALVRNASDSNFASTSNGRPPDRTAHGQNGVLSIPDTVPCMGKPVLRDNHFVTGFQPVRT